MNSLLKVCGKEVRIRGELIRIARLEGDGYDFIDDPEAILAGLRKCGRRVDIFSFMQRVTETEPRWSYFSEWDNYAALPVTTFDNWWTNQIGFKARNKAKQAEKKGVTIRVVPFDRKLSQGIWEVYNECPIRQGRPFRHYGKSVERVHEEEATFLDHSVFIGAYLDEQLIGFVKLVDDGTGAQAGLMNICSMIGQRDKAPTNALVAHAVRSCAERGIRFLVYSQFEYQGKDRDGIAEFKERNGFQKVNVPRYYIPLSGVGRTSLDLGLHKPMLGRVPAPIVEKVREIRNAWYKRKFPQMAGE